MANISSINGNPIVVGSSGIEDGAVTSSKLGGTSVTESKIANGAVTAAKLAVNSVTTNRLVDGVVTGDKLGGASVTNAKLSDGSVTANKLLDGSVTTDKVAAKAITSEKMADNSVGLSALQDESVSSESILPDSIDNYHLKDAVITDDKLVASGGILEAFGSIVEKVSSSNKFNKNDIGSGYLTNTGTIASHASYFYTNEYITVNTGDIVNFSTAIRALCAYDYKKDPLPELGYDDGSMTITTYTVPSGVKFIRICGANSRLTNFAITINEPAVYVPWFTPYYNIILGHDSVSVDNASFIYELNRHHRSSDSNSRYINDATGELVIGNAYSTTEYIPVHENEKYYITFSQTVATSHSHARFVAMYSDRYVYDASKTLQLTDNFVIPSGVSFIRVTMYADVMDYMCLSRKNQYSEAGIYVVDTDSVQMPSPDAFTPIVAMPKEICVAVGRTIEIYNNQVCINADRFHVRWYCNVGYQYGRKFQIVGTPANVGTYTATMTLYDDDMNAVFSGTTTINIVNDGIDSIKVCPIGDSLTNRKAWLPRVMELNDGIEWVGTRWGASTLEQSTYRHEGRSGATAANYLSDWTYTGDSAGDTSANPFWNWNTNSFDWDYYKTTYNINPDAVMVFLGTNGLTRNNATMVSQIMEIVSDIRSADATIPIYLVNTLYYGPQNGIAAQQKAGNTDGFAASIRGYTKYEQDLEIYDLITRMYAAADAMNDQNLHFMPVAYTHDSEYNFGAVETPVNPYATQTELMPTEATHPQEQGYYQMADIIYSTLCAYEG